MTFNVSQPRDPNGRFASTGYSPTVPTSSVQSGEMSIGAKIAIGAGAAVAARAASTYLAPLVAQTLGNVAKAAGVIAAESTIGGIIGAGTARAAMARVAGARLGAAAGWPGAIAGFLLGPVVASIAETALTPRPEAAAALIGAAPRVIEHLATGH